MTFHFTIAPPADTWLWWQLIIAPLFVALCTFLGGLAWAGAVAASRSIRSFTSQVVVDRPIDLAWLEAAIGDADPAKQILAKARLYCLLIRFGTDEYLASLASEQERYQGRLINAVIEIDRTRKILALPVHRRLGTQFKLYFLVAEGDKAGVLWDAIRAVKPSSTDADHRIILDRQRPAGRKCWFRLAAYGARKTVDRFEINYFPASQVRGFERRNELKLWRWIRRKDQPE